jgi:hypothetical protein
MVSSGMLRLVAFERTDVIRMTTVGELGTTLRFRRVRQLLVRASVIPRSAILVTLMKEALSSSETSVVTRVTRRNIPEDTIFHSHRCENLKSPWPIARKQNTQLAITTCQGS